MNKAINKSFHYIYIITNLVNNHQYVGKHSTNNLNDGYWASGKIINLAKEKYGEASFKREIIFWSPNFDANVIAEQYFIKRYHTYYKYRLGGYNLTLGGDGWGSIDNPSKSKTVINKIRLKTIGQKRSIATKMKMSQSSKAKDNIVKEKIYNTKLTKYGHGAFNNIEQTRKTCIEKYGAQCVLELPETHLKSRNTKIEKYNSETFNNSNKRNNTNIEKYGNKFAANKKIICEYCGHTTSLAWYCRKHKNGICLSNP